jgi:broad specificity phosphatase PhoE
MNRAPVRAIFIRHAQSTANAGLICDDIAKVELSELGRRQARELAAQWTVAPDLIVTSPYPRAQQTAEPTIERFPAVRVEVWPIEEFTYLQPIRWNRTSVADRRPHVDAYWEKCDPEFCDGAGAESFAALLARTEHALDRLADLPPGSRVFIFTHGQFMQAVRMTVLHAGATATEKMRAFGRDDTGICNCDQMEFLWLDGLGGPPAAGQS